MHVIIDLNCLSSCLSCLIKDSLGSVLFSEVQWSKTYPQIDVPQWEIIPTTDEHGFAQQTNKWRQKSVKRPSSTAYPPLIHPINARK